MENNIIGFSTNFCQTPTNKNIQITYVPKEDTANYIYEVYKDSSLIRTVTVDSNRSTKIFLDSTGIYKIHVNRILLDGKTVLETSCQYIVDKEKPILTVGEESLTLIQGGTIDVLGGVEATDNIDGNLTSYILTNADELNFETLGKKQLTYTISDKAGNTVSKNVYVNVVEDPLGLLLFQSILIVGLMFVLAYILRYHRSLVIERRIERFSINPLRDDRLSIFDRILNVLNRISNSMKPTLNKSVFLTNYSKRYEKYVGTINYEMKSAMDFVSVKILVGFLLMFLAVFSQVLHLKYTWVFLSCHFDFISLISFFALSDTT